MLQPQPSAGRYGEGCGAAPGRRTGLSPPRNPGPPAESPRRCPGLSHPAERGGRVAPGAAGEADDGSGVSPGASGGRGLSCLRAGPGTGGKDRARGHSWGWELPRRAVEQGRRTPSLPHCTPQAASSASLPPPPQHLRATASISSPLYLLHAAVLCWVVLTNPVQVAGEHSEKCPNANC